MYLRLDIYKTYSWNMIFTKCPNDFGHTRKIDNLDPYNVWLLVCLVCLVIATNIPVLLKTGFVVHGYIYKYIHIYIYIYIYI